jgi:hypothetical protein
LAWLVGLQVTISVVIVIVVVLIAPSWLRVLIGLPLCYVTGCLATTFIWLCWEHMRTLARRGDPARLRGGDTLQVPVNTRGTWITLVASVAPGAWLALEALPPLSLIGYSAAITLLYAVRTRSDPRPRESLIPPIAWFSYTLAGVGSGYLAALAVRLS